MPGDGDALGGGRRYLGVNVGGGVTCQRRTVDPAAENIATDVRAVEFGAAAAIVAPILARRPASPSRAGNSLAGHCRLRRLAGPADEPGQRADVSLDAAVVDQALRTSLAAGQLAVSDQPVDGHGRQAGDPRRLLNRDEQGLERRNGVRIAITLGRVVQRRLRLGLVRWFVMHVQPRCGWTFLLTTFLVLVGQQHQLFPLRKGLSDLVDAERRDLVLGVTVAVVLFHPSIEASDVLIVSDDVPAVLDHASALALADELAEAVQPFDLSGAGR